MKNRIEELRQKMADRNLDGYIIYGTDDHQNEYLPKFWKRRDWISGFTGSYGYMGLTLTEGALWTDSRYFLQGEEQLKNTHLTLQKLGQEATPALEKWFCTHLPGGSRVGVDPRTISISQARKLKHHLAARGITLEFPEENLVDLVRRDTPPFPVEKIEIYSTTLAGMDVKEKLEITREKMKDAGTDVLILSKLDSIAWLFNIRGQDIDFNPLVISYGIITLEDAFLFLKPRDFSPGEHFAGQVILKNYDCFKEELLIRKKNWTKIWIDENSTSQWILGLLEGKKFHFPMEPVTYLKSEKNEIELEGMKKAHIKDGVAMVKFLMWLEQAVPRGQVSEASAADTLEQFRRQGENYRGPSFATISGYKDHGAVVHYSHTQESSYPMKSEGLYLVDSGGQYLEGTTDITRTLALGIPTTEQVERFTLVLQGHIDLALCRFPRGTTGAQLDTIARKPLWDAGLDYGHGTGHGVGVFLNVHEGPHAISPSRGQKVKLREGMICSNEPGYYKAGEYGIRIENIVYVVEDNEHEGFFRFETLSLCPIDCRLINTAMLTSQQKEFLNTYHQKVKETLSPLLAEEERRWLTIKCQAL